MKNIPDKCFAALDIGTNSFHMIIAKLNKKGKLKILDREREVIRLTSDSTSSKRIISENEIKKSIEVLNRFKKLIGVYKAELFAAATSAVRESKNKDEFVEIIEKKTGIKIQIINGKKEAELIFTGIKNAIDISQNKVLCIDIGGGSTEFISSKQGMVEFSESIKIGAVKLTKLFFPDFIINDKRVWKCRSFVREEIEKNRNIIENEKFDYLIGSSGTIEASANMINFMREGKSFKRANGFSFSYTEFAKLSNEILSSNTKEERLKIKGMEPKRADIIQSGIIILDEIFKYFEAKKIVISKYALREGMIYSIMEKT
jgi:exopolyphosphatase / guanosine-5'-triphosphate,3'-diphosphate pyrophosphatase